MRKIIWNVDLLEPMFLQKGANDMGRTRFLHAVFFQLLLILGKRKYLAMWRLLACSVDLQIAHDHESFPVCLEINKRVGHEHAHSVEHVRVALAIGDDE